MVLLKEFHLAHERMAHGQLHSHKGDGTQPGHSATKSTNSVQFG